MRHATSGNEIVFSPIVTGDKARLRAIVVEETWVTHGHVAFWDSVAAAIPLLAREAQRRVLLVFGSGLDTARLAGAATGDVLAAAQRANVMIYGVSLEKRGLDASLRRATSETGGGEVEVAPSQPPGAMLKRLVNELHSQYALGIEAAQDGRQHALRVEVNVAGVTVRSRKSYFAR
jgi:hypothetical protein